MTAIAGQMLIQNIIPIISAIIWRGGVKPIGCEDPEELIAEGSALAAMALESLERNGKEATPGNIAFYTIRGLRAGKRTNGRHASDVMHPMASIRGTVNLVSIDAPTIDLPDTDDHEWTLHDTLASSYETPDEIAPRKLDWDSAVVGLNDHQGRTFRDAAFDVPPSATAETLKVSRPRITQLRREVGQKIVNVWGVEEPHEAMMVAEPRWRRYIATGRERRICRDERKRASY